jgi:hypothetical protein
MMMIDVPELIPTTSKSGASLKLGISVTASWKEHTSPAQVGPLREGNWEVVSPDTRYKKSYTVWRERRFTKNKAILYRTDGKLSADGSLIAMMDLRLAFEPIGTL